MFIRVFQILFLFFLVGWIVFILFLNEDVTPLFDGPYGPISIFIYNSISSVVWYMGVKLIFHLSTRELKT